MKLQKLLAIAVLMLVATAGHAMFRAADLVVIPVAASLPGANNSEWHTDLEIYNADEVPVDVMIVFLPSGNSSKATWFADIGNHLGGRADEGFGYVDERLAGIEPGHTVTLEDVVRNNWGDGIKGPLLIFAYEAGTLTTTSPAGGNPKRVLATSRTYTVETAEDDTVSTYGQTVPGLPWYDYIDPQQEAAGLNKAVFTGIREDDRFRTNVGMVNVSDRLTTIRVLLRLFDADGTELAAIAIDLQPLAHVQYDQAVRTYFRLTEEEYPSLADATMTAEVVRFSSTAADPTPALMVYASKADNVTNDPVYIEQSFTKELPWDCIFNGNCTTASSLAPRWDQARRRPLDPPTP